MSSNESLPISRRDLMAGAAALAATAALPSQAKAAPAKFRRWNISDPNCPPRVIASYKKAIRAMLQLPASDPRNWYRYTLIHTLDCPHGNWWFLPWHRGYIGWFEQICRELSEDADFALPYWDWTKEPRVPKVMFDDVLDPNNPAFIATATEFKAQFKDAIGKANYWAMTKDQDGNPVPTPQYNQLLIRSVRFPDDLWFDIIDSPAGALFFDRGHARGLSAAEPDLLIPGVTPDRQSVLKAVSLPTILDALAPRDFLSFGSPKALGHSSSSGFSVLENQPHNLVHNCVGGAYNGVNGFMQAFMSPTDPIFYLHHSNIDRLWDVWTRKQMARGAPTLPDGAPTAPGQAPTPGSDYIRWAKEDFVFFIDAKGQPVAQNTAGAYAEIGAFDYDYSPGSGEEVVPVTPQPPAPVVVASSLTAMLARQTVAGTAVTEGAVTVPLDVVEKQADPQQPKLFASITVDLPPGGHDDLDVFIKGDDGKPQFVATLSMFGHHVMREPVTFQVPLSAALSDLQTARKFDASPTHNIPVVPRPRRAGVKAMAPAAQGAGRAAHDAAGHGNAGNAPDVTAISLRQL
jgi:tyrosinase